VTLGPGVHADRLARPPRVRAVLFDMDGVLFEGHNFWLDLHKAYGTDVAGLELAEQYLRSNYEALAARVGEELWRGKPAATYEELVAARQYQPDVEEVFTFLHRHQVRTAIVSSGPDLLAARARADLGLDVVRANGLQVENGLLTGRVTLRVSDTEKDRVGREVLEELDVTPAQAAAVGDSESDAPIATLVALAVAYDSKSEALNNVATYRLRHGELGRLSDILANASPAGA
jgi:phosphoserine phosphatase